MPNVSNNGRGAVADLIGVTLLAEVLFFTFKDLIMWINVCQNDDQGNKTKIAHAIHFANGCIVESSDMDGNPFCVNPEQMSFEVEKETFNYLGHQEWWGSMAYNGYAISRSSACRLVNLFFNSGKWHFDDWPTELINLLEKEDSISEADFIRIMNVG